MLRTAVPREDHDLEHEGRPLPWPPVMRSPVMRPPVMRPPVMRPVPPPPRARSGGAPAASRTAAQRRAGGLSLWLAVYIVLNIGDLITTNLGLHSGLREGNPLMRALLGQFGFGSLIGYKLLVVAAVLVGIHMLSRRYARLATITLIICNVLVGLAVLLNIVQYVAL